MARSIRSQFVFWVCIAAFFAAGIFGANNRFPWPMVDEGVHIGYIRQLSHGNFEASIGVAMLPGYHLVLALAAFAFHDDSLFFLRTASTLIGFCSVVAFHACVRLVCPACALQRTLAFVFLPVLLPYQFLVYTQGFSVLLVLCGTFFYLKKRPNLSSLFFFLSILVRQTNLFFLGLFLVMDFLENHEGPLRLPTVPAFLWRRPLALLSIAAAVLFLAVNHSGAMGSQKELHPFVIRGENVLFFLATYSIIFAPRVLIDVISGRAQGMRRYAGLAVSLCCAAYFFCGFRAWHPYNQVFPEYFLRNGIFVEVKQSNMAALTFLAATLLGVYSISRLQFSNWRYALWIPCTAFYLLPQSLVEVRYFIEPIALLLVLRKPESGPMERVATAWSGLLALATLLWVFSGRFL